VGVECSGTAQFAIPKVLHWHNKLYYDHPMLLLSLEPFPFQITLKLSPNEVLNDGSHFMPDGVKKRCIPRYPSVPVKLKLQHPPRAFDCASCPGRGEFERCLGRVGNLNQIYLLF